MTSSKSSDNQILKVDALKRVHVPKARREAILDEFERSGLSGAAFAKLHGLKYGTFATWSLKRRKQASRGAVATEQSVDFARVIIDQGTPKPTWQDPGPFACICQVAPGSYSMAMPLRRHSPLRF